MTQVSEAQLAANQANAQHSTGPSTPEGKAISSQNNFRHGLTQSEGDLILLESESKEAYAKALAGFQAEWKPKTETEHDLVERLASRQWLRRRAMKLQTQFLAPDGRSLTATWKFDPTSGSGKEAWPNHPVHAGRIGWGNGK
jgi:hypothetical protein